MDDTESYHIQSIKWIKEYGTVPGLVNLHERYGFNSSWFSSVALFSFSNRFSSSYTALNGVLSLWLSYWFLLKFEQFRKENNINAVFAILITFLVCLFAWPLIRGNSATSNYDFVTTFVVLILFSQIFLSLRKEISVSFEWIILPAYLFTVRIMNFPLLLLSFFALIFFISQKNYKIFFLSITYCLLMIAPFLARNVIVAGLPFYPSTIFDWFNVDWKTDPQITESLREFIKYFNRVSTRYLDIEQTKALGSAWSATWYRYLSFFDKAIVLTGLAGFIFSTLRLFIDKNKYEIKSALVIAMSFVWLICWFLIAPDPRFVYGILLLGVFLLFYHLVSPFENLEKIKRLPNIVMIIIIGGLVFYLISKSWNQKEYQNWALPAKLPEPPTQQIMIDGITFRIPERINNNWNARCYGSELPCLYIIHPRLRVRGKNIRNGFHLEK